MGGVPEKSGASATMPGDGDFGGAPEQAFKGAGHLFLEGTGELLEQT